MELKIFLLVVFSAVFQACWNFSTKSVNVHKTSVLALGWLMLGLALLPVSIFFYPKWPSEWWVFILCSGLIHTIYIFLLGWAYSVGDVSVVFPIARGGGILITTIVMAVYGDALEISAMGGIVAIALGTFFIGLCKWPDQHQRLSIFLALLVAVSISSYSLVDSFGARQLPILVFITMMNLMTGIVAIPVLFAFRREKIMTVIKNKKKFSLYVAVFGAFSYSIILYAFSLESTSKIVALREVSVVFASVLGVYFLKEKLTLKKGAGIFLIFIGSLLIKS